MSDRQERIQVLYEIALAISPKETLGTTVTDALSGYLQKLNCSIGAVFESTGEHHRVVEAIPTDPADDPLYEAGRAELAAVDTVPVTGRVENVGHYYVLDLPRFGALLLGKYGSGLADTTVSELEPLNEKLADACRTKRMESELHSANARLQLALEETETGIWEYRPETEALSWDDASRQLFGYESGAVTDEYAAFRQRVHPDDLPDVETAIEEAIRTEEKFQADFRVQRPSSDDRWLQSRGQLVTDETDDQDRLLGIQTDITDRKKRERQLQETKAQLEQTNERLEKFASIVSHDLRNPLGIADMYLDFAKETGDPDDFAAVQDALDRMDEMIDDLLMMSRADTVVEDPEVADLAGVIEEVWSTLQTDAATLELRVPDGWTVEGDPDLLQHVFENLFRNSLDHAGSSVEIVVGLIEPMPTSTRSVDDERGFYVADDGPGIPDDEKQDVFEHGHSTDEEGTGLGLSIVRELVTAHGWEITVTDATGGGARFEITGL